jgi:hypothetical protein
MIISFSCSSGSSLSATEAPLDVCVSSLYSSLSILQFEEFVDKVMAVIVLNVFPQDAE